MLKCKEVSGNLETLRHWRLHQLQSFCIYIKLLRVTILQIRSSLIMIDFLRYVLGQGNVHPITGNESLDREKMCRSRRSLAPNRRWWVVSVTLRQVYLRTRLGTHCIGGWIGSSAGLNGCGKSRTHWDSIPGPSSPYQVAIPTEHPRPTVSSRTGIFSNDVTHRHTLGTFILTAGTASTAAPPLCFERKSWRFIPKYGC
jgi:hypothetical protein